MLKLALASASTRYVYDLDNTELQRGSVFGLVLVTDDESQSRDQSNPSLKYTTITAYDDDRAPIGVTDHKSKIDQDENKETWFFREPTGQVDVYLDYYQGPFAEKIGGKVAFPWGKNYASGGSKCINSGPLSSLGSSEYSQYCAL